MARSYFEGRAALPANQLDYAYFAEGLVALYDNDRNANWLDRAEILVGQMVEDFWDVDEGGFFMGSKAANGAALPIRPKDLHDSATPSGNGVAMRVLARLWNRTGNEAYRDKATELLAAFSPLISQQSSAYAYLLVGAGEFLWGESGATQYAARGNVSVRATAVADNRVRVDIDIAPGWHINAHQPLQDYLIGTQVESLDIEPTQALRYPEPKLQKLGFARETLALYERNVAVEVALRESSGKHTANLNLRLQACNDEVCLAPETLRLVVSR